MRWNPVLVSFLFSTQIKIITSKARSIDFTQHDKWLPNHLSDLLVHPAIISHNHQNPIPSKPNAFWHVHTSEKDRYSMTDWHIQQMCSTLNEFGFSEVKLWKWCQIVLRSQDIILCGQKHAFPHEHPYTTSPSPVASPIQMVDTSGSNAIVATLPSSYFSSWNTRWILHRFRHSAWFCFTKLGTKTLYICFRVSKMYILLPIFSRHCRDDFCNDWLDTLENQKTHAALHMSKHNSKQNPKMLQVASSEFQVLIKSSWWVLLCRFHHLFTLPCRTLAWPKEQSLPWPKGIPL